MEGIGLESLGLESLDRPTLERTSGAWQRQQAATDLKRDLDRALEPLPLDPLEEERRLLGQSEEALKHRVAALEATSFSPTTKLIVSSSLTAGATHFGGSQNGPYGSSGADPAGIPSPDRNSDPATNNRRWGAAVVNYEVHLNLLTSFTGKDLLYTRLNSGNAKRSSLGGNPFNLLVLDKITTPRASPNVLEITRLYYRFPLGRDLSVLLGPRARPSLELPAIRPWFYGAETGPPILDFFSLNGAPATYNKATGAAIGARWQPPVRAGRQQLAMAVSYVAPNANNADGGDARNGGGVIGEYSRASLFAQVGLAGPQSALAVAWRRGQCDLNVRRGTQFANQRQPCGPSGQAGTAHSDNVALTASWQPAESGWRPSISAGWGYSRRSQANDAPSDSNDAAGIAVAQSWSMAFAWSDVLVRRNAAGFALGQPTFATALRNGRTPRDGNYAWEFWYSWRVSDAISITPSLFVLSRPNGQYTEPGRSSNALGGVIVTNIRF